MALDRLKVPFEKVVEADGWGRLRMSGWWMSRHRLLEMLNVRLSLSGKLLIEKQVL